MNLSSSWEEVSMLATTQLLQFFFSFYASGLVKCHPLQRTMLEVMGARSRQRRKSCQHESRHRECDASRPTCALGQPWRHKLAAIHLILQDIRDLLSAGCSKHSLDATCYQEMGWQISPGPHSGPENFNFCLFYYSSLPHIFS